MELLGNWSVELSIIQYNQGKNIIHRELVKESSKKFDKINENFSEYLQIVEEIKKLKPSLSMKNANSNSLFIITKKLNEESKQDNKIESNFTAFINDLFTKEVKLTDNSKIKKSIHDSNNILNEIKDETPRLLDFEIDKKEANYKISNEIYQDNNEYPSFSEKVLNRIESINNTNNRNSFLFKLPLPLSRQTNTNQELLPPLTRKSTTSLTNFFKNIRLNNNLQVNY